MPYSISRDIEGRPITIETGKLAVQADGAVTVRLGDTMVLATAVMASKPREGVDFLPLTVDYEERMYAAGKIPGSFFRREGRPGTEAILTARLTDRPLRPLFPKGLRNDVQVIVTVLSVDRENPPEVLSIIGASAALSISRIPWDGPVGACRVGYINGRIVLNPTFTELAESDLNLVVASTRQAVIMVEAGAKEVPESVMLEAIQRGHEANQEVIQLITDLARAVGQPKTSFEPDKSEELDRHLAELVAGRIEEIIGSGLDKQERERRLSELQTEVASRLPEDSPVQLVAAAFEKAVQKVVRARILNEGIRPDGRRPDEIRPITCEVGLLPRTHGSGLFTRGLTQVMSIVTLGSMGMEQTLDTLSPEETKRFMHHYNFPPYSVGEVRRIGSPGRREIGHGALAERALQPVIPGEDDFPYAIRIVSDVLSSNGSTSMASVCGSTLALMDAGVPIKAAVAGVAMGLVEGENGRYQILTDIEGMEDFLGDMDFKVAGTTEGVTALQMDIKARGLTQEMLTEALERARRARLYILDLMQQTIAQPRAALSPYAPKMFRTTVPVEKIGAVIGSGGRTIRAIIEETGASIDIDDHGVVIVGHTNEEAARRALDRITNLVREVQVGDIFTGKVARTTSFGVFVEILPGREGLIRTADLGDLARDGVKVGQEVTVMVSEIDSMGRINLSRKAIFQTEEERAADRAEVARRGPSGPRFGGRGGPGGFRGDRGGDRGGPRRFDGPREGAPREHRGPGGPGRPGGPGGYGGFNR